MQRVGRREALHRGALLPVILLVLKYSILGRPIIVRAQLRRLKPLVLLRRGERKIMLIPQVIVILKIDARRGEILVARSSVVLYDVRVAPSAIGRVVLTPERFY